MGPLVSQGAKEVAQATLCEEDDSIGSSRQDDLDAVFGRHRIRQQGR
jgi:hypothetical protein